MGMSLQGKIFRGVIDLFKFLSELTRVYTHLRDFVNATLVWLFNLKGLSFSLVGFNEYTLYQFRHTRVYSSSG